MQLLPKSFTHLTENKQVTLFITDMLIIVITLVFLYNFFLHHYLDDIKDNLPVSPYREQCLICSHSKTVNQLLVSDRC